MPNQLPDSDQNKLVKIGEAAKILGVSIDTLRRWEIRGKIATVRTPGGTRLYPVEALEQFLNKTAHKSLRKATKSAFVNSTPKPTVVEETILAGPKLAKIPTIPVSTTYISSFETPSNNLSTSQLLSKPTIDHTTTDLNDLLTQEKNRTANPFQPPTLQEGEPLSWYQNKNYEIFQTPGASDQLKNTKIYATSSIYAKICATYGQFITNSIYISKIKVFILVILCFSLFSIGLLASAYFYSPAKTHHLFSAQLANSPLEQSIGWALSPFNSLAESIFINFSPSQAEQLGMINHPKLPENSASVLAASSIADSNQYLQINSDVDLTNNLAVEGQSVFKSNITAPNVIYSLVAGNNITISQGQTPTISVTGKFLTTEADTLATVTARGATTTTPLNLNGVVTLGNALNLGQLSNDPTSATNGETYYNTTSNQFRCYQNGSWKNCDTVGATGMTSFTLSGSSGSSQTVSDGSTITIAAGNGVTTTGSSGPQVTVGLNLTSAGTASSSTSSSGSGLEIATTGLSLLRGCNNGQLLKWDSTGKQWTCSNDLGGGTALVNVQEGGTQVPATGGVDTLNFTGADFNISNSSTVDTISFDYTNFGAALSGGSLQTLNIANSLGESPSTVAAGSAQTINIGGVSVDKADTVNIATNSTTADTIRIGNTNASTSLSLLGTVSINTSGSNAINIGSGSYAGTLTLGNSSSTIKLNLGSDSTGDIYYRNSSGNLTRLGVGSDGNVLTLTSGLPSWTATSSIAGCGPGTCIINNPSASQTISPSGAATVGLSVAQTLTASPTADIFNVTNSTGATKYLQINSNGSILLPQLTANRPVITTTGGQLATEAQLASSRGGTGVDGSTAVNGSLLIGNGAGYSLATLTAGTAIGITNGVGTITIANNGVTSLTGTTNQVNVTASTGAVTLSLPQSIATASTPTFASLTSTPTAANSDSITVSGFSGGTNAFTGTITSADLTAARTWTFPDTTGNICLSTGNCAGAGTGVTQSGTNASNQIAFFTNGNNITSDANFLYTTSTTTGTSFSLTNSVLTTGKLTNFISTNNSAANTAWIANQFNITNAQGTTAVSTGSIIGLDVEFTQNTAVSGNNTSVAQFNVKRNDSASTDQTVSNILSLANNDTATGNQITVTDGLKINGANITNGINLSGIFGSNLITSSNFTVSQTGAITAGAYNKVTFTTPATSATLTLADGSSLITSGSNSLTFTTTGATNLTIPAGSDTAVTLAATQTLTNKTLTSPKVGTAILDTNGNNYFTLTPTASANNYLNYSNAANSFNPAFTVTTVTDPNAGLNLTLKGTGGFVLGSTTANSDSIIFKPNTTGTTAHTLTLTTADITADASYTIPSAATTANDTFCLLTLGNCVGTGGGITGAGTTTQLAFFDTSSSHIGSDSNLYWDNTNKLLSLGSGTSPAARLDVTGLSLNTNADGTIGAVNVSDTINKNDGLTKTFPIVNIKPTLNAGASNTSGTINILNIDTTNTATTGLITNLIKASYGGTQEFLVDSSGNAQAAGALKSTATSNQLVLGTTNPLTITTSQAAARTATIPQIAGADTFCFATLANCTGAGGGSGVTFTGYSANAITKFTSTSGQITASSLTDTGTAVSLATTAATSGSPTEFTITGPADTTLTAAEASDINFNLARAVQFTGSATPGAANIATQRAVQISSPTYSFSSTGAQTIANASTLAIAGGPLGGTNATLTNSAGLRVDTASLANVTNGYGIYINAPSGATNNYVAGLYSTQTAGTLITAGAPSATTLGAALTGFNLDLSTNYTATGFNVTGQAISLPAVTNTGAGTYNYKGLTVSAGALTQNTGAGVNTSSGIDVTTPNITQTTGTLTANGLNVTTGTITTGGSQNGLNLTFGSAGAGTLTGINIGTATGASTTKTAVKIGSGWNNGIDIGSNSLAFTNSGSFSITNNAATPTTEFTFKDNTAANGGGVLNFGNPKTTAGDPATCTVGDIYFNSSGSGMFKGCASTNTWISLGNGGTLTGTGNNTSVAFWTGATGLSNDGSNFVWNSTAGSRGLTIASDVTTAASGTGLSLTANSLTTGTAQSISSTSNGLTTGSLLSTTWNPSAATTTSYSGNLASLSFSPTYSTAITTPAISGNALNLSRSLTTNGAFASTLSVTGAVATLSNSATQTTGTITDSSNILSLSQNYASATGAVLAISNSGSGNDIVGTSSTWNISKAGAATFGSINKVTVTAPASSATLTLANGSSLITSGGNSLTFTTSGTTNLTLPAVTDTIAVLGTAQTFTALKTFNSGATIANNSNLVISSGTGQFQDTYVQSGSSGGNAQALAFQNTNSASAGTTVGGLDITPTNTTTPASGTNILNLISFEAGSTLGGADNTNGINFASATGYTNFLKTPTAVLNSVGTLSGLTGLTVASGGETITAGGLSDTGNTTINTTGSGTTAIGNTSTSWNISSAGVLTLGNPATTQGQLVFANSGAGNTGTTIFQAGAQSSTSLTYTLPTAMGTNGQALTLSGVSGGNANLTWSTVAAGLGGSGTSGQITYWNGPSSVTGNTNFTFSAAPATGDSFALTDTSLAAPTGNGSGNLADFIFTNTSVNTSGTSKIVGLNIAPTNNSGVTSGATMETYGEYIQSVAGTLVAGGTKNNYGLRIGNQGQSGATNSYGLYVDSQSNSTNSYAAVFAGGNVGIGITNPAAQLDLLGPNGSAGNPGTAAALALNALGGTGGAGNAAGAGGGAGGAFTLQTGPGGAGATNATTNGSGGNGGLFQILGGTGGNPGSGAGTAAAPGAGGNITLTAGNAGTGGTGNANGGTLTLNSGAASGTGTSTLNLGSANVTNLNIGTAAIADTITIGNTTGTTGILEKVGTGNYSLDGVAASTYSIGASTVVGTIAIGGTGQTGNLTLGQSTATNTINIGNGNIATGNIQTINIGTAATATGKDVITIGNNVAASSLSLAAGTGNIALTGAATTVYTIGDANTTGTITLGQSTAGQTINIGHATVATGNTQTINIGDAATGTGIDAITIGNSNGASSLALKAGSGGTTFTSPVATGFLFNTPTATDDQLKILTTSGGAGRFTGTIQLADLTANTTYTLPNNSSNPIDTFCIKLLANCFGSGSGVTASGTGLTNQIAYFTSDSNISGKSAFQVNPTAGSLGVTVTSDITTSASGNGLTVTTNSVTTGTALAVSSNSTGITTGTLESLTLNPTFTANSTLNGSNGNLINISRSLTDTTNLTGITVSSPVASITDNCTVSGGATCTSSGNVMSLTQSFASATGDVLTISNAGTGNSLSFAKQQNHTIAVLDSTTAATVGGALTLKTGAGAAGAAVGNTGGAGGLFTINANNGGASLITGTGNDTGGAGGGISLATGIGGAATGAVTGNNLGGAGGAFSLTAGNGGNAANGTGTNTGGAGGNITLTAGNAGTGGNANGGSLTLASGTKTGSGTAGNIALNPATGGNVVITQGAGSNTQIIASAAPTTNLLSITNSGQGTTTNGVNGLSIDFRSAANGFPTETNSAINIATTAAGDAGDLFYGINLTSAGTVASDYYAVNLGNIATSANAISINTGTISGTTTGIAKSINTGNITTINSTASQLALGAISGSGTIGTGITIGAISSSGATNTGISVGNISAATSNNYGIKLGTLTGGTAGSVYGITSGILTVPTSGTIGRQLDLGSIVSVAGATVKGVSTGAISGPGTASYGIDLGANTSTATTNYGVNIGAISGAGTNNYGINIAAVSGSTNNYAINTAQGQVNFLDTSNSTPSLVATNNTISTLGAGVNTTGMINFQSSSLTTGNLANVQFNGTNQQTTGTLLNVSSVSTALAGTAVTGHGLLGNFEWNPGSASTVTGDLFRIAVNSSASVSGNIFDIVNGSSSIFSVNPQQFTTSVPANFSTPGDISAAYDLNFTNPTSSFIKSAAPLVLQAGETFNSSNLTLKTFNQGSVVFDESGVTTGTAVDMSNFGITSGIGLNLTSSALTSGQALSITAGGTTTLTTGNALLITGPTGASALSGSAGGIVNFTAAGNYTSTNNAGLLNLNANATTAGTIENISGTGLTTGKAFNLAGGTAMTTGNIINIASATYVHTVASETGSIANINFTDSSTLNSAGTTKTIGVNISPTFGATGASGTHEVYGQYIQPTTISGVPTGTNNSYGLRIGNQGGSGITNSYGLYVDNQSGSATNNYAAQFAGGKVVLGSPSSLGNYFGSDNIIIYSGGIGMLDASGNEGTITNSTGGVVSIAGSTGNGANPGGVNLCAGSCGTSDDVITTIGSGYFRTNNSVFNHSFGNTTQDALMDIKPPAFTKVYYCQPGAGDCVTTGTFTDDTAEAKTSAGTPFTLLAATGEYLYVGFTSNSFKNVYFNIATPATGVTLAADTWTGASWGSTTLTDGTSNLTKSGNVSFTSALGSTTVNGQNLYWVRFKTTTAPSVTPTAYSISGESASILAYSESGDSGAAFTVDPAGNVVIGNAALATTARVGFLYIPSSAGAPTGVPSTTYAGTTPVEYDTTNNKFMVYNGGWKGAIASDFSEWAPAKGAEIGDIVTVTDQTNPVNDPVSPFMLGKTIKAYDQKVIGVVSKQAEEDNNSYGYKRSADYHAIALVGRVPVKVSTENGPVAKGDLLTSSSTPGVAMKATRAGQVIGTATQDYNGSKLGQIMVFINPHFADPTNALANMSFETNGSLITPDIKTQSLELNGVGARLVVNGTSIDAAALTQSGEIASAFPKMQQQFQSLADSVYGLKQTEDIHSNQIAQVQQKTEALDSKIATQSAQLVGLSDKQASTSTRLADLQNQEASNSSSLASLKLSIDQLLSSPARTSSNQLNLTSPDGLIATGSAQLANPKVDPLSTLDLNTSNTTVSETLKSLGQTFLGQTTIAGDFSQDGTLSITEGNKINALPTLYFQNSPLAENVDFFNGLITIDKTGKIQAGEIQTTKLTIAKPTDLTKDPTIGTGIIKAGATEVAVFSNQSNQLSKIFVTPRSKTGGQTLSVTQVVDGSGFIVTLDHPISQNISFDWWVVGTK